MQVGWAGKFLRFATVELVASKIQRNSPHIGLSAKQPHPAFTKKKILPAHSAEMIRACMQNNHNTPGKAQNIDFLETKPGIHAR